MILVDFGAVYFDSFVAAITAALVKQAADGVFKVTSNHSTNTNTNTIQYK